MRETIVLNSVWISFASCAHLFELLAKHYALLALVFSLNKSHTVEAQHQHTSTCVHVSYRVYHAIEEVVTDRFIAKQAGTYL